MSTGSVGSTSLIAAVSSTTQSVKPSQQASIAEPLVEIKHNYVNMTKLKLDIIDNFVRKK